MKKLITSILIVVFSMALSGCSSKVPPQSNSNTVSNVAQKTLSAREAFQLAVAEAKKWKPDAKLYSVSQRGVLQSLNTGDKTWDFADVKTGQSRRWVYEFFSDKSLAVLFVEILDGKPDSNEISKFDERPPAISDKWVDSNTALTAARAEIEKALHINQDQYMALSKLVSGDKFPVWIIEFYESKGDKALYGVVINAMTGKVEQSEKAT